LPTCIIKYSYLLNGVLLCVHIFVLKQGGSEKAGNLKITLLQYCS